ncbi:hypothetical protein CHLNCDRAFT_145297 [Chlorella variabilis]|uniref:Complex 1 LYR protein domain-containing protein n=1 Tax=Chlorella variabilis TaxID=554065 RepID=E1ZE48_CHLVA|nr:hypothetical protein CHLNCDRAFT_145297 [Chlorella variabilis]EFN55969.1 hypothetical protein CHLNCDRAFT_145297 [Chlorella variabilis]|eukprot:XP_005848071.1 hypothetical protein CHLNCDRAFT_145297 [Chlorella variabilis]
MAMLTSLRRLASSSRGLRQARPLCSGITYGASDADVDALIEESLDKTAQRKREDESPFRLLTTRREALALYREIWRISALFDWPDEKGRLWRDVLRESARQEFEAARCEVDPEIVNRLLVVGRDAMHQVAERFLAKRRKMLEDQDAAWRAAGQPPAFPPSGSFDR